MIRFLSIAVLTLVTLLGSAGTVGALAQPAPVAIGVADAALYPDDIFHPVDLDTFSFTLVREHTGSGAVRTQEFYQEWWEKPFPGIIGPRANNAPFVIEWAGDYENPGRFAQALRINDSSKIYAEWFDGDDGRIKFADNGYKFATGGDMQVFYWWDHFADWLDNHGDAVSCSGSPRTINDEQAIRCTAPNLSREARVGLVNALGLHGQGYPETISRLSFELWLHDDYSVPVRLSVSATGVDEYGRAFISRFALDLFDLDSEDIYVDLPR